MLHYAETPDRDRSEVPRAEESSPSPGRRRDPLAELRLNDLFTVIEVYRTGSVTSAARHLGVTPSQVSKTISRIEAALKARLFTRGVRGVALSPIGRRMIPQIEQMMALSRALGGTEKPAEGELTIAAPSSLLSPLLPGLVHALPRMRVRGIEVPETLLRAYASDEIFDVALLPGGIPGLPTKWANVCVGELRMALLASPTLARRLGPRPTIEQMRGVPFVGPVAYDGGKLVTIRDDCPLPVEERKIASEVATMDLALRVAAACDYVVFGPVLSARAELEAGTLVELDVRGWSVSEPLYLACHTERLLARTQRTILEVVRGALGRANGSHAPEDATTSAAARCG
jgi:DNA-binding transcriptional LysR family regulator